MSVTNCALVRHEEIERVNALLAKTQDNILAVKDERDGLLNSIRIAANAPAGLHPDLLISRVGALRNDVVDLKRELTGQKARVVELEVERDFLRTALEDIVKSFAVSLLYIATPEQLVNVAKTKVFHACADRDNYAKQVGKLKTEVTDLKARVKELEADNGKLGKANHEYYNEAGAACFERDKLRAEVVDLKSQRDYVFFGAMSELAKVVGLHQWTPDEVVLRVKAGLAAGEPGFMVNVKLGGSTDVAGPTVEQAPKPETNEAKLQAVLDQLTTDLTQPGVASSNPDAVLVAKELYVALVGGVR